MRWFLLAATLFVSPVWGQTHPPGGGLNSAVGTNGVAATLLNNALTVGLNFIIQPSALTGTGYNVANSDAFTTLIVNSSAITINFATSTSSYLPTNSVVCFINEGTGNATLTPTGTSSFKGATLSGSNFIMPPNSNWCAQTDNAGNYDLSGWSQPIYPASSVAIVPQGRLSLSATYPVQKTDVTAGTTLYYLPYTGTKVSIYSGTAWFQDDISTGISLSVNNGTNFPASTLFDVYVFDNSGTPTLCATPWGTSTAGSSSRGASAAITQATGGVWTNSGAWSCYAGATTYTLTTNEATLLGSFVTTSAGAAIEANLHPAAAAGGPTNGANLGYANIYNQVPITVAAKNSDNYTTTTTGLQLYDPAGACSGLCDRTTWVDPLGNMDYSITFQVSGHAPSGATEGIGVAINNVTPAESSLCAVGIVAYTTAETFNALCAGNPPQATGGLNYAQAIILTVTGTSVYSGISVTYGATTYQAEMLRLSGVF